MSSVHQWFYLILSLKNVWDSPSATFPWALPPHSYFALIFFSFFVDHSYGMCKFLGQKPNQLEPLQWQCWILNVLPHKRTLGLLILARWSTVKAGKQGICSWVRFYLISEAIFILLRLLPANGSVGLHILWPHKAPAWDKSYEQCPYISVSWSLS